MAICLSADAGGASPGGWAALSDAGRFDLASGASSAESASEYVPPRSLFDQLFVVLELLSERVAVIASVVVLLIAFANVTDVILRNFFSVSLYGLNEINVLLVAIAVSTCLAYGMVKRIPLTIEFATARMPRAVAAWCGVFGAMGMLIFLVFLAWRIGVSAEKMAATNTTTIMTDIQKWPFFAAVALAIGFAAFVQFFMTLRAIGDALAASGRGGWIALALLTAAMAYGGLALANLVSANWLSFLVPSSHLVLAGVAFLVMWVIILLGAPLGVAMGLVGMIGVAILFHTPVMLEVLGSETTSFITLDAMAVLPLFLLMGTFAQVAGIGTDLYRFSYALIGHVRGGLAHASILACAGFGMLTGSSVATQMSIGKIALKEMQDRQYSPELSSGAIAAGGTLGQLIPPSSALILYAIMTEQSVGRLFVGAIIPGFLAALLYMTTVTVWVAIFPDHAKRGPRNSLRDIAEVSKGTWGMLLLLGLVLGGIYFGFFTELEAGAVGAAGGFLMALLRGRLTRANFWATMAETTKTLALMYSLIFGVVMLSYFFGIAQLPQAFIAWINSLHLSPVGVVLCLVAAYLILGTAMDAWAMMVITIPIFVPLVQGLGFDPIWWGVMTLVCMEAGMISPPFGINIFIISSLDDKIPLSTVYRGCWPFFTSTVVKIGLLILFPAIVTWLPATM